MTSGDLRLAHTDWLAHSLTITGPMDSLSNFLRAAAGAGVIPWHIDWRIAEEDYLHMLLQPEQRTLTLEGAKILASQLRQAAEQRHQRAIEKVGRSRACALDLHSLLPVPNDILFLGPLHPTSLAWLQEHWGTTDALRQVTIAQRGLGTGDPPGAKMTFWSSDWTPWAAIAALRRRWADLKFDISPAYGPAT